MDIQDIKKRFGFIIKSHRIGELNIRIAQIDRVDRMVREIYPDALIKHGDAPVWMITWPAAFALAEYILLNHNAAGLRILELGCGTAAPGIALEKAGAYVISTDYDHLTLSMARYNAQINKCNSIEIRYLDWYNPDIEDRFDLVVGSDIVYFEKSFKPLLSVIKKYVKPEGKVLLSDPGRPQMKTFLKMCVKSGFTCSETRQMLYLPDSTASIRITSLLHKTRLV